MSRVRIPDDSHKFIFRPMVKSKSDHTLVQDDRHISYTTFRENLKSDLQGIVPNTTVYSSHSLRSGGATKAAKYGDERSVNTEAWEMEISNVSKYVY